MVQDDELGPQAARERERARAIRGLAGRAEPGLLGQQRVHRGTDLVLCVGDEHADHEATFLLQELDRISENCQVTRSRERPADGGGVGRRSYQGRFCCGFETAPETRRAG